MASDQIMICDHIKFKIFEPGILLGIVGGCGDHKKFRVMYTNNEIIIVSKFYRWTLGFFLFAGNLWVFQSQKVYAFFPKFGSHVHWSKVYYEEDITFYDFLLIPRKYHHLSNKESNIIFNQKVSFILQVHFDNFCL